MQNFNPAVVVFVLLFIVIIQPAAAQEPLAPLKVDIPPVIDGVLNESIWEAAPSVTGFKTWLPDFGREMLGETETHLAYDRDNLYFAFRCSDSEPGRIKASITNRDGIDNDDWICIYLDSFNDQQSLYVFYVNPLGIQMDARTATSGDEDYSVDMVWLSEGQIDEQGYTVEIQIPFKSIRYPAKEPVEMGVLFERKISRASERGTYPALDPQAPSIVNQTRAVLVQNINKYHLFELLPAVTFDRKSSLDQDHLVPEEDKAEVSLTAKYGLTSDLIIDGTYNPDFSQVEADASQVDFNIRYGLYYEEKRPFFLEGKEHFNFGGNSMQNPLRSLVHTRTIVDPLFGIKLTGKLSEKNTVASIFAVDDPPANSNLEEGARVAVLRYRRTLGSDSFCGAFATARELNGSSNLLTGTDGQIRLSGPARIGYHGFVSRDYDPDPSTKSNGHALGFNFQYNTRDWFVDFQGNDLSENFNTEVGYLTRAGVTRIRLNTYRMLYPDSKFFLRFWPMFITRFTRDKPSGGWEYLNALILSATLPRSSRIRLGYVDNDEIYLGQKFDTSYFRGEIRSQITKQLFCYLDYRYQHQIRYVDTPYQGYGHWSGVNLEYQPVEKFNSSLSLTYRDFYGWDSGLKEFDYTIIRFKNTYQLNRYLFFRAIEEYNVFRDELMIDFLASFTYIPGTVIHFGYGSMYGQTEWDGSQYVDSGRFIETRRGLFFKASYLWRM
jgi:hypothetical protein